MVKKYQRKLNIQTKKKNIYDLDVQDYRCDDTLIFDTLFSKYRTKFFINDEVEIIEEEKKIPERLYNYISCGWNGTCKDLKKEELYEDLKKIGSKVNEIIDYLKSKGE